MLLKGPAPHRFHSRYQVSRRDMRQGRALRIGARPYAGESLIGFVARRTAHHQLLDVSGVLKRAGLQLKHPGYVTKLPLDLSIPLADILGCLPSDIAARAAPLKDPSKLVGDVVFGGVAMRPHDIELEYRRIAPGAFGASPFHRSTWLNKLLPFCPESFELLRSDCSECGAKLGWRKACGVERCETCEEIVTSSPQPLLARHLQEGYKLFARLSSMDVEEHNEALEELPTDIRALRGRHLIDFIVLLGLCVSGKGKGVIRNCVSALPPEDLSTVVSTGAMMAKSWPAGMREWATSSAARLASSPDAYVAHRSAIRNLGARARYPVQADIARAALPELFVPVARGFIDPKSIMLVRETAKFLGVAERSVQEIAQRQFLPVSSAPTGGKTFTRFYKNDIIALRERLENSRGFASVIKETGLPHYALEQAVCHGLLEVEECPAVTTIRAAAVLTGESLTTLEQSLHRQSMPSQAPTGTVALATAVRRIGGRLKPWGAILDALTSGSLPFWQDDADKPWVRQLRVWPQDIVPFDQVHFNPADYRNYPFAVSCGLMDAREILNLMGVLKLDLRDVFSDEISSRPQSGHLRNIGLEAVLSEGQRTISIAEICARNGWNPRKMKWELRGLADAKRLLGYDRSAVEASGLLRG